MLVELENTALRTGEHVVEFYDDDVELAESVCRHVLAAHQRGARSVVIATEAHRRALASVLDASGLDSDRAMRSGSLVMLDAAVTLEQFSSGHEIDAEGFRRVVGGVLERASEKSGPVFAYGEMVALLWEAGHVLSAIELEKLWNELGEELEFSLLCGYRSSAVAGEENAEALTEVCRLHSGARRAPATQPAIRREFPARVEAPASARRFVAEVLREWGHGGPIVDDAQLVISELATNAVVHACSPFTVTARPMSGRVHLAVEDASADSPGLREGVRGTGSGHGLHLIAALAERWGVDLADQGKAVWAELAD